ncbi:MAG: MFS transporter [Solirubrobacteraceae bacterium]
MTLAMAAVGDLVSPRERGRYQGYIAAVFAGVTVLGPLAGGLLVDHASWRWVFYVNVPLGITALLVLGTTLPAPDPGAARHRLDLPGAALLVGATTALLLACVWGGDRYDWASPTIVGLIATSGALAAALVARERKAEDPIVPLAMLRSRAVAVSSIGMFLDTVSLFAVVVFVPLFLQTATGADPTEAGLLLVPMMLGTVAATNLAGRRIARTGRYRRYPAIGLALMAAGLLVLAAFADEQSRTATGLALVVFGVGFGLVSEVFMVAVQNAVDRRELGTATGLTGFFRALGGSIGAAVLGVIFAAQSGTSVGGGAIGRVDPALAGRIADAVQTVFLAAVPLAVIGALVALRLPGKELRTDTHAAEGPGGRRRGAAQRAGGWAGRARRVHGGCPMTARAASPAPRARRRLSPGARRAVLSVHVIASVGLLGASSSLLLLAVVGATSGEPDLSHSAYRFVATSGYAFGIPLSFTSLITGVTLGLGTKWGVLRHRWVTAKLALLVATILKGALVIGSSAERMVNGPGGVGSRLIGAAAFNVVALMASAVLSIYKPRLGRPAVVGTDPPS